jgi:hypothetical protein
VVRIDESLYDGITEWASHAPRKVLSGLTAAGIVIGTAVIATDWRQAPVAGLLLVAAAIGGWGLIEQRASTPHSRLIRVTRGVLPRPLALGAPRCAGRR